MKDSQALQAAIERELGIARIYAACKGDDDRLDEAEAELQQLRRIQHAAELACGLLWQLPRNHKITEAAFKVLRDALGGPGSAGLARAIRAAKDYGAKEPV
jgi:hypothetical protein